MDEKLFAAVLSYFSDVGLTQRKTMSRNGKSFTLPIFKSEFLDAFFGFKTGYTEHLKLGLNEAAALAEEVYVKFREKLIEKPVKSVPSEALKSDINLSYTPVWDIESNKKFLISEKFEVTRIDYENWREVLEMRYGPEAATEFIKAKHAHAAVLFSPKDKPGIFQKEIAAIPGKMTKCINLYHHPKWRLDPLEKSQVKLPELIDRFLKHFFTSESSRKYALFWYHTMITSRNETALTAIGAKGIGKGTWALLGKSLVGDNRYYGEAHQRFFSGDFNSQLRDKIFYFIDEKSMDLNGKEKIKKYLNKMEALEAKGVNIEDPTELFVNFMICNNSKKSAELEYDDRRFSVVEITENPLFDNFTEQEREDLEELIVHDHEFRRHWGWYVLHFGNCEEFSRHRPFKPAAFYEIVEASMKPWQRALISKLEREKDFYFSGFLSEVKTRHGHVLSLEKLQEFIQTYESQTHQPLAEVVFDGDEEMINSKIYGMPEYKREDRKWKNLEKPKDTSEVMNTGITEVTRILP